MIYADRIAQAVQSQLKDSPLAKAPLIGTFSEIANFTTLYENVSKRPSIESIYLSAIKQKERTDLSVLSY